MKQKLLRYLVTFNDWRKKRISKANFLIIAAAATGIIGGITSSVLKELTHALADLLQNDFHWKYKYYLYLVFPLAGIFLTIFYIRIFIRRSKFQKGIPAILNSISRNSSKLDFHNIYSQVFTSALTVGLGGSAGLESPAVSSGSAAGSNIGRFFGLSYRETTLLLACGGAAGISGAFDSPVAGMIFAIEVLLPEFSIPAVIPLLIASALSSVVSRLIYNEPLFVLITKPWVMDKFWYYILFGILVGLFTVFYSKINNSLFRMFDKINNRYKKVWIGGSILGVMIFLIPALYGEGYISIQKLLDGNYTSLLQNSIFSEYKNIAWALLLFGALALVGKAFASVITMACGGNGGMFGPTVGVGGFAGFVFAFGLNQTGWVDLNITNFMIAGMAASVSGVMHAPLTGVFLAAEITGGYALMVPLMIVSALSYFINKGILKYSIYTKVLADQGTLLSLESQDNNVLKSIRLKYLIEKDFVILHPDDTVNSRASDIVQTHRNVFPVVNSDGMLTGILFSDHLLGLLMSNDEQDRQRFIKDIAQPAQKVISDQTSMEDIIQIMDRLDLRVLPVTDSEGRYLGFVSKNGIFKKYRNFLLEKKDVWE